MSLAIDLIKTHEGFRGMPYADTEGHATIGYGTKLPLDEHEADLLLRTRMNENRHQVRMIFPTFDDLNEVRQAVIQDMLYNLGPTRLRGFARMREAVRTGDYERAAKEMLDSRWARQVKTRADRLAKMMETGEFNGIPYD